MGEPDKTLKTLWPEISVLKRNVHNQNQQTKLLSYKSVKITTVEAFKRVHSHHTWLVHLIKL